MRYYFKKTNTRIKLCYAPDKLCCFLGADDPIIPTIRVDRQTAKQRRSQWRRSYTRIIVKGLSDAEYPVRALTVRATSCTSAYTMGPDTQTHRQTHTQFRPIEQTRRNSALCAASLLRAGGTGALCWPSIWFVYTGTRTVQYSLHQGHALSILYGNRGTVVAPELFSKTYMTGCM